MVVRVFVPGAGLLPLREVTTAPLVDVDVTRLLALREVTAMLLLRGLALFLLAGREAALRRLMIMVVIVVLAVVVTVMVIVTFLVAGLLAHSCVSERCVFAIVDAGSSVAIAPSQRLATRR
jgi:hypothetical protein